jgi:iron complex outermembrane receptor protein
MTDRRTLLLIGASTACLLASAQASAAQTAPDAAAATNDGGVQEILVTAQRRSENLQAIPISIQAISADKLQGQGNASADDLTALVPGLVFPRSIGGGAPYLRGEGNVTIVGGENAVAYYIDGVFLQKTSGNLMSFNNIERVEVLKGPQGTLFGRNAVGGLIHVITKDPSHTTSADLDIGFGSYSDLTGNLFATTGLSDNVATSIALTGEKRFGGWGKNIGTGNTLFKAGSWGAQHKILYKDGSGRFSLLSNVIHSEQTTNEGAVIALVPGTFAPGKVLANIGDYTINNPAFDPRIKSAQTIASLKGAYEFDGVTVSNTVAYVRGNNQLQMNLGPAPVTLSASVLPLLYYLKGHDKSWTDELQLQSAPSSTLKWVLGGFYMSYSDSNHNDLYATNVGIGKLPGITYSIDNAGNHIRSLAVFGQATYPIVEGTNLTLGARYTNDRKQFHIKKTIYNAAGAVIAVQDENTFANAAIPVDPTKEWSAVTWRAALDHKFSRDVMIYAAFNTGFKGGQFSTLNPNNPAARPERVTAYTAGIKSELFDRHLRLNIEGFYNRYRDMQLKVLLNPGSTAPFVYNAAAGTSKGFDLEMEAALAHGLTLTGALEYLDAKYTKFANAPCFQRLPTGGIGPLGTGNCDLSGGRMIRAPKLSFNLSARYVVELANGGNIALQAGDSYNSGFAWDPDQLVKQESYHNVSASARWTSVDKKYEVGIWGKNLADEKIWTNGQEASPYESYYPGQPRTYGVTLSFHY